MKKTKFWQVIMLLVVLSTVLVACSNDNDVMEEQEENPILFQETLTYGTKGEPISLDPARVTDVESLKVTVNIFETLLNFNEQDMTIESGLAKDWKVSKDGLTYRFDLKEGVKFHDDTDLTAEAVVKNFERWANGSADTFPLYGLTFGGFKSDDKHVIESVKADGKNMVVIELKRPQTGFLEMIAGQTFAMASPTAFEEFGDEDFEENPVGTGPYRFVEWKHDDSVTIARFVDYHHEGLPKLSKVTFIVIPNHVARLNALLAGDLDLADELNRDNAKIIETNDSFQLIERPATRIKESPGVSLVDSTQLLGAIENLTKFQPHPSGVDLLSHIEIPLPVE